jgi:hypothetical protein
MPKRLAMPMLVLVLCAAAPAVAGAAKRDRDHDGLPDRWEKRHHLSTSTGSAKFDPDHDGLKNGGEYRHRTKPHHKDTDRDRLRDGVEVKRYRTNPRRKDTDGDGLRDRAEIKRWKTNPRRADTDGDGFNDGVELYAGTNPRDRRSHPATGGSQPASCSTASNTAGGRDPWGGCWPGPGNTGVPSGTSLSNYTGPCTITAANTVIAGKTIGCNLTIRATGVTISKSKLNGTIYLDNANSGYSFTIVDSEVNAGGVGNNGIGNNNFVAVRVHVYGGYRGIWCENNCTVQDSYVHGQATDPSGQAHESAMRMGQGSVIRHNTLLCDAPNVPPDAGCSADLTGYGDFAPIRNNTIERNLFLATTGGACAYGGSSGGKPYSGDAANIVFRQNVFQRSSAVQKSGKCGYYFPVTDFSRTASGNQWTGNTWDDGSAVSP